MRGKQEVQLELEQVESSNSARLHAFQIQVSPPTCEKCSLRIQGVYIPFCTTLSFLKWLLYRLSIEDDNDVWEIIAAVERHAIPILTAQKVKKVPVKNRSTLLKPGNMIAWQGERFADGIVYPTSPLLFPWYLQFIYLLKGLGAKSSVDIRSMFSRLTSSQGYIFLANSTVFQASLFYMRPILQNYIHGHLNCCQICGRSRLISPNIAKDMLVLSLRHHRSLLMLDIYRR